MLGSRWVGYVSCVPCPRQRSSQCPIEGGCSGSALWPRATRPTEPPRRLRGKATTLGHCEPASFSCLLYPGAPGRQHLSHAPRARGVGLGAGRGGGGGRRPRGLAGMRGREGRAPPRNGQECGPVGTRHSPLWPITARWAGLPPEGGVGVHRGRGARGAPDNWRTQTADGARPLGE